ncbi:MAG: hypothetical protein IJ620_03545 [Bacteroidales bacterium]|nr:hypothetical protein [Bacteroidales bacterium]
MANRFRIETQEFTEETELVSKAKTTEEIPSEEPPASESVSESDSKSAEPKSEKKNSWSRQILGAEFLNTRKALRYIPLMVLIVVCSIVMVSNRYRVEKLRKEIINTQKEIDQLSLQQIELKSQYQQSIKISNISSTLDSIGIHLITEPPLTLKER